ncbi:MAG TPA: DUF484 domain-containing protein [Oxalobacteraceae bacterium]|nr:DUF484 domain-containing protein [Oxalobacteraceae bacterium]
MTAQLDSHSVAMYLLDHPHFFEEHADLLAQVKLASPLGGRAVSLQERQMEVLRHKYHALELKLAELVRIGRENDEIAQKFQQWACALLTARNDVDLPHVLIDGLQSIFGVPYATLRLWGVAPDYSHTWFAADVSDDARLFANGLNGPFCGRNNDFEVASWIDEAQAIESVAILPLRRDGATDTFGLLVLGSPDAARFTSDMATDFLARIGDCAAAAMTCLLD